MRAKMIGGDVAFYSKIWPKGSTENAGPENEGRMKDQIDQRPTDTTGK